MIINLSVIAVLKISLILCLHNQYNIIIQYTNHTTKNFFYHTLHNTSLNIPIQFMHILQKWPQYQKNQTYNTIHQSLQLLQKKYSIIPNTISYLTQQITFTNIYIIPLIAKTSQNFLILQLNTINKTAKKIIKLKFICPNINYYKSPAFQTYIQPVSQKTSDYLNRNLKINTYHNDTILSKHNQSLPKSIQHQLHVNNNLNNKLTQQIHYINSTIFQQKTITTYISQTHHTLTKLLEQTQWLNTSSALKEILRAQISKLPNTPNLQQIDHKITRLQKERYQYEQQKTKQPLLLSQSKQDNGTPLTLSQKNFLKKQLLIQHHLINSVLNNYDTQILEYTKLKFSCEQLQAVLQETKKTMYRYLFWVVDIYPITTSYPLDIYQDYYKLFTENRFKQQIKSAMHTIYSNNTTLTLIIFSAIIAIGLYTGVNQYYQKFLIYSNKYIGNVNQDNFVITLHNIWYSIIIALPIPILWLTIGYICNHLWAYPFVVSIGNSIYCTTFILWISIISFYFASPQGLFIVHFGWSAKRLQQVFSRYYILSISIIIILIMALIIFNNYNEKEFYSTLGRLCFIILCIYLSYITNNLKKSKLPLYINKHNSSNNIINDLLWNIMVCAPILASFACAVGYFFVAQTLLIRLETSLFIWIILLIIYHLIKRWMSIQRRRIALENAKHKRAQKLALRTHKKINFFQYHASTIDNNIESNKNIKKISDLDTINTQSLQLIRSIITLVAMLSMTVLWSELHPAFSFLENITLWDVTSTIKGVNNIQPITLNSLLIAILVIIITTKTVHNLPALLELTLLQYLRLTPSTRYAITTLTKYILMLLGSIIGCSLIGIEWSKIQWLIAALGVGLGFGLQEIFANFISGLMILFEKPIRIGDTITIQNFTGNVTHINTRATTIIDWDHKEIIIPNKEFITQKFTNWSLSDTITRVVLKVPGPIHISAKKTTSTLLKITKNSTLILHTPSPEVYLLDLQQGFPIFEIRIYVAHTKLRMPVCHQIHLLIIEYYQKKGITLPYLPHYIYNHQLTTTTDKFPIY